MSLVFIVKPYKHFISRGGRGQFCVSCNATNYSNFNHKTVHHWQDFKLNYGQCSQQFVSTVVLIDLSFTAFRLEIQK